MHTRQLPQGGAEVNASVNLGCRGDDHLLKFSAFTMSALQDHAIASTLLICTFDDRSAGPATALQLVDQSNWLERAFLHTIHGMCLPLPYIIAAAIQAAPTTTPRVGADRNPKD